LVDFLHSETTPDLQEVEESPNVRRVLLDLLETIVISLVLFLGINTVSERIRVESISMQPNLYAGDFVIVNKLAYKLGEPQRGDIIVFRYPPDPDQTPYIKRIIGLPGDQIHIADGEVFINGKLFAEPFLQVSTNRGGDWSVPENSLFVLGDNRNNSSDSRAWGMVPLENIIGKAVVIYWPPENWRVLHFPAAVAAQP
jgi:signal peptidase I